MKILHINTLERSGGAARVAYRLCLAQREAGHDSQMLVGQKESPASYTHRLEHRVAGNLRESYLQKGLLYYEVQGSHFLLEHPLVKNADILHLHNLHGGYFNPFSLALLGQVKPIVWTLHDMQAITGHCAHSFACEKWREGCAGCPNIDIYPKISIDSTARLWSDKRLIYNHAPFLLVAPSHWLEAKVQASIMANHSLKVIPNGVDTKVFKPYDKLEARQRLGLPAEAFVVGGVAQGGALLNGWKGGEFTLEGLRQLFEQKSDSYYVSIGGLTRTIDCDGRIISLPSVESEEEMAWIYSAMDLYLMSSVAENCPLVVLEALACGVPVLAFATGGVPELVTNGVDGLVVGYCDVVEFCRALLALSKNPQLLRVFSLNARGRAVSRFDHKKIEIMYIDTYCHYQKQWEVSRMKFPHLELDSIPSEISTEPFLKSLSMVKIQQRLSDFKMG